MSQTEKAILEVQAAVYNYDNNLKNWAPKDTGSSRVFIFHNPNTNAYRVIGQSTADKQYNINTPIKSDLVHKKLRDNFVQWRFRDTIYGLSFKTPEDADRFDGMLDKVVERLQAGPGSPASALPSPTTPTATLHGTMPAPIPTLRPGSGVAEPSNNPTPGGGSNLERTSSLRMDPQGNSQTMKYPNRRIQSTYTPGTAPEAGPPQEPPALPSTNYSSNTPYHMATLRPRAGPPSNALYLKDAKDLSARDLRAREIYTSEESYMLGLDAIIDKYLEPNKEKKAFSPEEIKKIFANIQSIRKMSMDLLEGLRGVMDNWTPETTIGDIFIKMIPFLKIYTEYCNGHKEANQLLDKLKAKKSVATFLKECQANSVMTVDLNALLITPVQRVPRYQLLLQELLKQTDPSHPDHGYLKAALEKIKEIADGINESVLCSDSTKEVELLKKMIPDISGLLAMKNFQTRQLVKHGKVNVTTSRGTARYTYLLLFSDILVFALPLKEKSKKLKIAERIKLHQIWLDPMVETSSAEKVWQLNTPEATYQIECANKDEKTLWVDKSAQRIVNQCEKKNVLPDPTNVALRNFKYKFQRDQSVYKGDWLNGKMQGTGTYTFATKNVYEGEWDQGKFNGKGVMTYITGEVYEGEWQKDKPHGKGVLKTALATYDGQWDSGMKHGRGTITWVVGDVFEGDFVRDVKEGVGTLRCADGCFYEGEWKGDREEGKGKCKNSYGVYEGDWVAGAKAGVGKMEYTNGDVYNGSWEANQRSGQGTLVQNDGLKYEGGWADDLFDGVGTLTKPGGETYEGEFKAGRRFGQGKLTTAEGVYEGQWADERREGKGTWKGVNGLTYDGEWHADLQFGKGTLIDVDKSRYDGKFVKGKKEGSGVMSYPSGAKYSGNWQRDKRHGFGRFDLPGEGETAKYVGDWVDDMREGKGTMTDASGSYEGEWKADMRTGNGKFTYANGNTYVGQWKDDRKHGKGVLTIAKPKEGQASSVAQEYDNGVLKDPSFAVCPPEIMSSRVLMRK